MPLGLLGVHRLRFVRFACRLLEPTSGVPEPIFRRVWHVSPFLAPFHHSTGPNLSKLYSGSDRTRTFIARLYKQMLYFVWGRCLRLGRGQPGSRTEPWGGTWRRRGGVA